MRRATLLAVVLVLAVGGAVQATGRVASVTGSYQYELFGGTRTVELDAHDGDSVSGSISYASPFAVFSGSVTCITVIGSDAWVAGPITTGGDFAGWAVRVRDGGTPGANGDMAITYVDTLEASVDFCQAAKQPKRIGDMVPVTAGNLVVRAAP
ncbi:MAG TPA: hypothetical protein VK194_11540 [Candidatus Deferrimicrobium sp.]|nr:hypothetical protein [Candidatus Deferrimicrobium sp.]